ncbi:hypothetical protein J7M22_16605 [Candidatus Poribacteria bacterium]|nr:hypothetical protein [Candidatus Poribacteria bacterium]
MKLKERGKFGKIGLAEGGDWRERGYSNLPLIPKVEGYPPNKIAQKCVQNNGCTSDNLI